MFDFYLIYFESQTYYKFLLVDCVNIGVNNFDTLAFNAYQLNSYN